jgi:hypothetical protein
MILVIEKKTDREKKNLRDTLNGVNYNMSREKSSIVYLLAAVVQIYREVPLVHLPCFDHVRILVTYRRVI